MSDINELKKSIQKTERILVTYNDIDHNPVYVITEHIRTGESYLYKVLKTKLNKIATSDIPYFDEPEKFLEKERNKI